MIAGFVANNGQSFETVLKFDEVKYDEDIISNEERSTVLQQKELIDDLLDGGTQSFEDDLKRKAEEEMCKDISTRQDQNCILIKEEVEQSPWTVMKSEEEENVLFKSMITKYNSVIDGMELMLCSDQHKKRIPKEISTGTSESHIF